MFTSLLVSALAYSSPHVMRTGRSGTQMMAKSKAIPFLDAPAGVQPLALAERAVLACALAHMCTG